MQIAQIDVFTIKLPHHYKVSGRAETPGRLPGTDYYVEPHWVHAYSDGLESCLIKITADTGAVGWGETQAPLTPATPCALITTLLGPALLGRDPLAISALHDRLYHLMLARGHSGGFLMDAIAGLDIALWDLKARHYGAPLFELLGGPFRAELPAYVSGLRVSGLEQKVAVAREHVSKGFMGVKIFSGARIEELEQEAREVRTALGDGAFFAVDAICKFGLADAMRLGETLDELKADWFEAPLNAEDVAGHADLAKKVTTPIAVGETLRTPRQFEPWLRQRALSVAQPDIMRAGITATMKIAALAETAHVPCSLHTGVCTGIGMAATWHVAAALPGGLPQEHQHEFFESVSALLRTPLQIAGGKLVVPARPGIGVDADEEAIRRVTTEHWVVDGTGRRLN
jgi:L-alanine-DL-glutamate epimerase-like enolase superfamily enzyme